MVLMNKVTPLNSASTADYTMACVRSLYLFYLTGANVLRHLIIIESPKKFGLDGADDGNERQDELLAKNLAAKESPSIATLYYKTEDAETEAEFGDKFTFSRNYYESRRKAFDYGFENEWVTKDDEEEDDDVEWEYYDEDSKPEFRTSKSGLEVINESEKTLIFLTAPNRIGLKKMNEVNFRQQMDLTKSLKVQ